MKCIGSDDPPCARCAKAGRECIVHRPARANQTSTTNTPDSHARTNETSHLRPEQRAHSRQFEVDGGLHAERVGARPNHNFSPINANQPALPSIYTTPPYSTVFNQADGSPNQPGEELNQRGPKRRRTLPWLGPADQSPRSLTQQTSTITPFLKGILCNTLTCKLLIEFCRTVY